jgi:flagellar motor switch protein FliN/FliY
MAEIPAIDTPAGETPRNLDLLLDIPLEVTAEIGRTRMPLGELMQLGAGAVVELEKLAGEPLDVLVNGKLIARGEAVMVNDKFGVRLTDIVSQSERLEGLK